jgi:hypothetical protein
LRLAALFADQTRTPALDSERQAWLAVGDAAGQLPLLDITCSDTDSAAEFTVPMNRTHNRPIILWVAQNSLCLCVSVA